MVRPAYKWATISVYIADARRCHRLPDAQSHDPRRANMSNENPWSFYRKQRLPEFFVSQEGYFLRRSSITLVDTYTLGCYVHFDDAKGRLHFNTSDCTLLLYELSRDGEGMGAWDSELHGYAKEEMRR